MKKRMISVLLSTVCITFNVSAAVTKEAAVLTGDKYKFAVVNDFGLFDKLSNNELSDKLPTAILSYEEKFETATANCWKAMTNKKLEQAMDSCDKAVVLARRLGDRKSERRSIAYNNRAMIKQLSNDFVGALDDLRSASKGQDPSYVKANLTKLTQQINQ